MFGHSPLPSHPNAVVLKHAVGPGMPNDETDVRSVEAGLSRWWTFLGKPHLQVETRFSARLEQEIRAFQSEVLQQRFPTGIVAPDDATAQKLAESPSPIKLRAMPIRPPVGPLGSNAIPGTPLRLPARTGFEPLRSSDYAAAARTLGCESRVIRALALQEGRNHGFDAYNRPTILYEPLHFALLFKHQRHDFQSLYPDLTHLHPPPHRYGSESAQWQHLQQAYLLNPRGALRVVSWGKFQILGNNSYMAGFATVESFVTAMCRSEQDHLNAFVSYIQFKNLEPALKAKDWEAIANGYNGTSPSSGTNYASSLKGYYDRIGE